MKKLFSISWGKSVFFSIILVVVLALLLWRPILVLYHQQQAGKIIDQVATSIEGSDLISYRCFLGQLNETPPSEISIAINHLIKARGLQLTNNYTTYLLGQAYCLNQEFEQATTILENTQGLKEKNPNLYIEAGFAYQALAYDAWKKNDNALVVDMITNANQKLQRGQINSNTIIPLANVFFEYGEFEAAYLSYWLAGELTSLSSVEDFRIFLINKVLDRVSPFPVSNFDIPVLMYDKGLIITPNEMYNLQEAEKISLREIEQRTFGMIWSTKSDAVMLMDFPESGVYIIEIQLLDRPPAPTRLQLSVDFLPVLEIELSNGDDQLKTFNAEANFIEGVHLLSIKLLNDAIINGEDRNGYINQISILLK